MCFPLPTFGGRDVGTEWGRRGFKGVCSLVKQMTMQKKSKGLRVFARVLSE